ncbi:MAG: Xaa-Pro peptidase family protein [Promethearchaeati archaeon SRVP18_Atabeyarchaeia-1]
MIREFPARIDKLRKVMERKGLNALLLMSPSNVYYVSGFSPMMGGTPATLLLPYEGEPSLILPSPEIERSRESSWIKNISYYAPSPSESSVDEPFGSKGLAAEIQRLVQAGNLSSATIGMEFSQVSVSVFEILRSRLEKTGFKDISEDLLDIRSVKDYEEVETLRDSLEITERGIRTAIELIQPGVTELEVAAEVERTMRKAGSRRTAFDSMIASGPRSGQKLTSAKQRNIDADEFVAIDISAIYNEYCSDVARTIYTGKPAEKHRKAFELSRKILAKTIEQIRPGATSSDMVGSIKSFLKSLSAEGGTDVTGHGIGLELYEWPRIFENEVRLIKPGMVMCIKVQTLVREIGGIKLEETVLVNDSAQEVLNRLPIETV